MHGQARRAIPVSSTSFVNCVACFCEMLLVAIATTLPAFEGSHAGHVCAPRLACSSTKARACCVAALDQISMDVASTACTFEAPCDLDWLGFVSSLALPVGSLAVATAAYLAGSSARGSDDDDVAALIGSSDNADEPVLTGLEAQAKRSRARRDEQLKGFAARLLPLQQLLGWEFVDSAGMPTANAWLFFVIALAVQASLLLAAWPRL